MIDEFSVEPIVVCEEQEQFHNIVIICLTDCDSSVILNISWYSQLFVRLIDQYQISVKLIAICKQQEWFLNIMIIQ